MSIGEGGEKLIVIVLYLTALRDLCIRSVDVKKTIGFLIHKFTFLAIEDGGDAGGRGDGGGGRERGDGGGGEDARNAESQEY